METRQLLRTDLPKRRRAGNSLHIPVLLGGKKRYVCDIHFSDKGLCYLEGAKGIATKISKLKLITDERSAEGIRTDIEKKIKEFDNLQEKAQKISGEIIKLRLELKKMKQ